jgi:hypothetical protein
VLAFPSLGSVVVPAGARSRRDLVQIEQRFGLNFGSGASVAVHVAKMDTDTILASPRCQSPRGLPLGFIQPPCPLPITTIRGVMMGPARPRVGRSHVIPAGIRRRRPSDSRPGRATAGPSRPGLYVHGVVRRRPLSTVPPSSSLSAIASPREGGETDASAHKARDS